jgi:hypothetical protein
MVNFGENFRHSIYANWVHYYVDYEQLQKLIYGEVSAAVFEEALMKEVKKCNAFLVRRANKTRDILDHLKGFQSSAVNEGGDVVSSTDLSASTDALRVDSPRSASARKSQKRALVDLYKQQVRLETFKMLNYTACMKILKKFDKHNPETRLSPKVLRALKREPFQTMTLLDESKEDLELFFAREFCSDNKAMAKTQLLLKQNAAGYWQLFQLGVRTGAAVVLLMWCLWDCAVDDAREHNLWNDPVMSVSTRIELHTKELLTSYPVGV